MASKIFAFEEKLKMYIEGVSDNDFSSFPKFDLMTKENTIFSDDTDTEILKPQFLKLLGTLKNEMNSRFNHIKNLKNAFRFIEYPWAVTTREIFEINIMNSNIGLLKSELIDLQQDIILKDIFNGKNNEMKFWNTLEEQQYSSLLSNVKAILTFFGSTYVCEAAFSKFTFMKNKYRNRLSNLHLDDLLRLSTSKTPINVNKIIKESEVPSINFETTLNQIKLN